MHLGLGHILQVRVTAFAGEEEVVLAPEDDRLGLTATQKLLPLRIERDVGAVVGCLGTMEQKTGLRGLVS
jgi:hypothetical protein